MERSEVLVEMVDAFLEDDLDTVVKMFNKYGILPTDKMVENEKARRTLTKKELQKFGTKEAYQLEREGEIY